MIYEVDAVGKRLGLFFFTAVSVGKEQPVWSSLFVKGSSDEVLITARASVNHKFEKKRRIMSEFLRRRRRVCLSKSDRP